MTLEADVAALVTASNALTQTVTDKQAAIDAKVAIKETEVDTFIEGAIGDYPCINLCDDSGLFDGVAGNPNRGTVSLFAKPGYIANYNGTTVSEAGRFYNDNSTNGGAGGALTQTVSDLLTAQGRAGGRFGTEFFVMEALMGSGTSIALNDKFLMFNQTLNISGAGDWLTIGFWVRAIDADLDIKLIEGYRNGQSVTGDQTITVPNGWTYISFQHLLNIGYHQQMPNLFAKSGNRVQLALFTVTPGKTSLGMPRTHIPTLNANFSL